MRRWHVKQIGLKATADRPRQQCHPSFKGLFKKIDNLGRITRK